MKIGMALITRTMQALFKQGFKRSSALGSGVEFRFELELSRLSCQIRVRCRTLESKFEVPFEIGFEFTFCVRLSFNST